jgi:hypothetical protein
MNTKHPFGRCRYRLTCQAATAPPSSSNEEQSEPKLTKIDSPKEFHEDVADALGIELDTPVAAAAPVEEAPPPENSKPALSEPPIEPPPPAAVVSPPAIPEAVDSNPDDVRPADHEADSEAAPIQPYPPPPPLEALLMAQGIGIEAAPLPVAFAGI